MTAQHRPPESIPPYTGWDRLPRPPYRFAGPARFGYPERRYSRLEELEARIARLETALASAGLPVPGEPRR